MARQSSPKAPKALKATLKTTLKPEPARQKPYLALGKRVEIFSRLAAREPEPRGELVHQDPFTLLIAVVLSAQATDAGVNKATPALFAAAPTPQAMVSLGEERLRDFIKTIGLYRAKAKNIIGLCEKLICDYGGIVPQDRAALQSLPGVGRKTANVVASMAFGQTTIAVDTHVFRVAKRLRLAHGTTPEKVEAELEKTIPPQFLRHAHHWLILHGRYCCKAQRPLCTRCPIVDLCPEKPKLDKAARGKAKTKHAAKQNQRSDA